MYSNEQCKQLVIDLTKNMEVYINILEKAVKADEPNIKDIANTIGKLSQTYSFITELVGTYSGIDSRVGGFKEMGNFRKDVDESEN